MPLYETEPDGLEGINAFYDGQIRPHLQELEDRRWSALIGADRTFLVCLLVIVMAGIMLAVFIGVAALPIAILGSIFLVITVYRTAYRNLKHAKRGHKNLVIGRIAEFLGLEYWEAGFMQMAQEHAAVGLLPAYDRASGEDGFIGNWDGQGFRLTEIHLERRDGERWTTAFRGILVSMDIAKRFSGVTVLFRNHSDVVMKLRERFSARSLVSLESPAFTDRFTVMSTDQVEARFLLTPGSMTKFMTIEKHHDQLVAAFADGKLHVAFAQDDRFEAGSSSDRLTDPALVRSALRDLISVRDLAGTLAEISLERI